MSILLNIFKHRSIREYQPVGSNWRQTPVCFFNYNKKMIACELNHILYNPVMIIVNFNSEIAFEINSDTIYRMTIPSLDSRDIVLDIKFNENISTQNKTLYLFEVLHTKMPLNFIENWYLKRIFNYSQKKNSNFIDNFTYEHYKKIVSLFANPKKVYLISIFPGNNKRQFPIDLCSKTEFNYIFGVRNTNKDANSLQIDDEFYISSASSEDYNSIYNLGKFSNKAANNNQHVMNDSQIPLPSLVCDYSYVKLIQKITLEFQTIYITKIIESKVVTPEKKALYHLHKLWFLRLNKQKEIELIH